MSKLIAPLILLFATLLRVLLGFQPHSGQDDVHGASGAYGGDFEAQRHWMELTLHLPIHQWYYYDLEYWGLDYPPLTAYVSYLCGVGSSWFVGAHAVALDTSRGIEDPTHKSYMRATVLVLDILIYYSAVYYTTMKKQKSLDKNNSYSKNSYWTILLALAQPSILLIDHGHFQYNTVALGLSLWAFYFMTMSTEFSGCIIGAIFYCLALNFKQMTLYFAPAVFFYLLGRCLSEDDHRPRQFIYRFCSLGGTVILCFAILWFPFLYYETSHTSTTALERATHVLRRIFPFQRGLFEGKVSNLWCALSTKPISIRDRIQADLQPLVALMLTLCLIAPASYSIFRVGQGRRQEHINTQRQRDWTQLLWASANTALAFFLASFQVHEKSILLALSPISLLLCEDPAFVDWFSYASAWTLWPLLQLDQLEVGYFCIMIIFGCLIWIRNQTAEVPISNPSKYGFVDTAFRKSIPLCYIGMMVLHVAEATIPAPDNLPDLYPVLWSIYGCGMFCLAWIVTYTKLLQPLSRHGSVQKEKIS